MNLTTSALALLPVSTIWTEKGAVMPSEPGTIDVPRKTIGVEMTPDGLRRGAMVFYHSTQSTKSPAKYALSEPSKIRGVTSVHCGEQSIRFQFDDKSEYDEVLARCLLHLLRHMELSLEDVTFFVVVKPHRSEVNDKKRFLHVLELMQRDVTAGLSPTKIPLPPFAATQQEIASGMPMFVVTFPELDGTLHVKNDSVNRWQLVYWLLDQPSDVAHETALKIAKAHPGTFVTLSLRTTPEGETVLVPALID